ncbi:hypothetical protein X777_14388 [Ooceraea biroi]|uniref:Uncharacterized protein n=1 Tax=Ooceraea biroi TaxID=2015173 RepID=A0A026WVV7_OOCBI|nr:hypothetical protein X777_14388 [Ooceraea biroi]
MSNSKEKVILAYSGGQNENLEAVKEKALKIGAVKVKNIVFI